MKFVLVIAALTLAGCANDPYAGQRFQQGFIGALAIGAQQEQMRNQQLMYNRAPPPELSRVTVCRQQPGGAFRCVTD